MSSYTIISMLPVMKDDGQLIEDGKLAWYFNVDVLVNETVYPGLYQWSLNDGDNHAIENYCQMLVDYYTEQDAQLKE